MTPSDDDSDYMEDTEEDTDELSVWYEIII
jgi:hypothetical protein